MRVRTDRLGRNRDAASWPRNRVVPPGEKSMRNARVVMGLLFASAAITAAAPAAARISVVFNDPGASQSAYYADLQRLTEAAGNAWTDHFAAMPAGSALTVQISFAALATSTGRSLASAYVGSSGGQFIYEQGAAHEWRTGIDSNGATPDVEITLGTGGYLQNELWFDPDPLRLASSVPADRTDAFSVLLHEWGHAFGFNGWLDGRTGLANGNYRSTFDAQVAPQPGAAGTTLYFAGARAASVYGAAVPLSFGNYAHLGNSVGRGGLDLIPDLMNGEVFYRGTRYSVSALDLAIMADVGLPMAAVASVPEPGAAVLLLAGLCVLGLAARRRGRTLKPPR